MNTNHANVILPGREVIVKTLSSDVIKQLRSDVAFYTISQCVEELIWNSIDAEATNIVVRLNLSLFKIQVIDNGNGIKEEDLKLVGQRYATSKCNKIEDLQHRNCAGFRGEAIASLKEVSMNLMIETRPSNSEQTFCKIFTLGKISKLGKSQSDRLSKGTTISVFEFLYNRPVRKSSISETLDLEEVRKLLQGLSLMHPKISFSLVNEASGATILQFKKCSSILMAINQLFGRDKFQNVRHFKEVYENYEINGFINADCHHSKDYQFVFVNKRLIKRASQLHKLINRYLNKHLCVRKKQKDSDINSTPEVSSPIKSVAEHCVFIVNFSCPWNEFENMFDLRSSVVEFLDWQKVSNFVEISLLNFLKREKLITFEEKEDQDSILPQNEVDPTFKLGIDNYKTGLFSHTAKRPGETKSNKDDPTDKILDKEENYKTSLTNLKFSVPSELTHSKLKLKSSLMENEGISQHQSNFICIKSDSVCSSILDKLKNSNISAVSSKQNILLAEKYVQTTPINVSKNSAEITKSLNSSVTKLDIPSRSVFPTDNPIMLHVPTKSNLSLLEKDDTALQRLREKYEFKPSKFKQSPDKTNKYVQKQSEGVKASQQTLEENTNNRDELPADVIAQNKSESRVNIVSKETSVVNTRAKSKKISSKYSFGEDYSWSMLKRFRHSKSLNAKIKKKSSHEKFSNHEVLNIEAKTFKTCKDQMTNSNFKGKVTQENNLFDQNEISSFLPCLSSENQNFEQSPTDTNGQINDCQPMEISDCSSSLMKRLSRLPRSTSNNEIISSPNKYLKVDDCDADDFIKKINEKASLLDLSKLEIYNKNCSNTHRNQPIVLNEPVNNTTGENDAINKCVDYLSENFLINNSLEKSTDYLEKSDYLDLVTTVSLATIDPSQLNSTSVTVFSNKFSNSESSNANEIPVSITKLSEYIQNKDDDTHPEIGNEYPQNVGCHFQEGKEIFLDTAKDFNSADGDKNSYTIKKSSYSPELMNHEEKLVVSKNMDSICSNEPNVTDIGAPEEKLTSVSTCRWISQVDENTKRISYIDTHTGNSTYVKPQIMQGKTNSLDEINNLKNDESKKHFFLTHDCSPFIKDSKDTEAISCSSTCALQSNLTTFMNELENEDNVKWRDLKENKDNGNTNVNELLTNWKNPMFDVPSEVPTINNSGITLPQNYTINSYRFNKATLKNLKVIGQVDCKFIACVLEDFSETNKDEKVLALFDQHAVHERIRLEELTEELYETTEEGEKFVKSSKISPFIELSFEPHEIRLIDAYQNCFKGIGLHISVKSETCVEVSSIPSCLVDVNTNKLKRNIADVSLVIKKSIKECLTSLTESRILSAVLPKTLSSVLNVQACRGAVKFGDPLDLNECEKLLLSLSECKLPFQCAHGRPSIAPILDLNKIETLMKKRSPPQLHKLIECEEEFSSEI